MSAGDSGGMGGRANGFPYGYKWGLIFRGLNRAIEDVDVEWLHLAL